MGDREKGVSVGEKIREKYDLCSSFLTATLLDGSWIVTECMNFVCAETE